MREKDLATLSAKDFADDIMVLSYEVIPNNHMTELRRRLDRIATLEAVLEASEKLAKNVEEIARDSFATGDGSNFEEDFKDQDPEGYEIWKATVKAISAARGGGK